MIRAGEKEGDCADLFFFFPKCRLKTINTQKRSQYGKYT